MNKTADYSLTGNNEINKKYPALSNISSDFREQSLISWAENLCQERKESIEYFQKFGSPIEKALVNKVVEIAEGKIYL